MSEEVNSSFGFISPAQQKLTPDLEQIISSSQAWASITPTHGVKPNNPFIGAFVTKPYEELIQKINNLEQNLEQTKTNLTQEISNLQQTTKNNEEQLKIDLKHEKRKREESDLILANHVAIIENTLKDNKIIQDKLNRINDAYSTLYYCQICFENERKIRFVPCGHVVSCAQCAEKIMQEANASFRKCPICRSVIIDTAPVFIV